MGAPLGCATRGATMYHIAMYHIIVAAIAVVIVGFPTGAPAQVAAAQIKLTEKHIEGFIAAQRDLSAVAEKMQARYFRTIPAVNRCHY